MPTPLHRNSVMGFFVGHKEEGQSKGTYSMRNIRNKLLVSAAAVLLTSSIYASAQTMQREPAGNAAQSQQSQDQKQKGLDVQRAPAEQSKQGRTEAQHDQTTGQGGQDKQAQQPQRQNSQQSQREQSNTQKEQSKAKERQNNQAQQQKDQSNRNAQQQKDQSNRNAQSKQNQTTGQADRNAQSQKDKQNQQNRQSSQKDRQNQRDQTTGQNQQSNQPSSQQGNQPSQQTNQQRNQPSQQQANQPAQQQNANARVELNDQQRTHIRETILARSDAPRVDRVDFSVNVGTVVPSQVRLVAVPSVLVEIRPEWRDHEYFIVRDEIVIVDQSRHIIATLPVGGERTGSIQSRGSDVALSVEEIRSMQIALKDKGFNVVVDGKFGPTTRQALIQFQQRQGLEASGRIDVRTRTALGLSTGGQQPSTTGQGGNNVPSGNQPNSNSQGNMPNNNQGNMPNNQNSQGGPNNQPSTTGQGGNNNMQQQNQPQQNQQPPATQNNRSSSPSGQGGTPPEQRKNNDAGR